MKQRTLQAVRRAGATSAAGARETKGQTEARGRARDEGKRPSLQIATMGRLGYVVDCRGYSRALSPVCYLVEFLNKISSRFDMEQSDFSVTQLGINFSLSDIRIARGRLSQMGRVEHENYEGLEKIYTRWGRKEHWDPRGEKQRAENVTWYT